MSELDSEYSGLKGVYDDEAIGVWARVQASWLDMRGMTRSLLDQAPSEGRLIFYLVISDLVFFLSWTFKTLIFPSEDSNFFAVNDGAVETPILIFILLLVALMVRTALFYVASVLVWIMCKGVGGQGNWRDTKAGMFWGSLVSAPFGFLAALLTIAILQFGSGYVSDAWAVVAPFILAMLPFVWYISAGVSESHKFTQSFVLFIILSIVVFGIIVALILLNIDALA
ncbi:MAG: hypothetical protein AAF826_07935 [Pseudomonadota bacterium]